MENDPPNNDGSCVDGSDAASTGSQEEEYPNHNGYEEDPYDADAEEDDQEEGNEEESPDSQEEAEMQSVLQSQEPENSSRRSSISASTAQPLPKISDMVNEAIMLLKERNGSTVDGIYTCLCKKYKMDPEKSPQHIRSYLKRAVTKGSILHTGGEGVTARYKLTPAAKSEMAKADRSAATTGRGRPSTTGITKPKKATPPSDTTGRSRTSTASKKTPLVPTTRAATVPTERGSKRRKVGLNEEESRTLHIATVKPVTTGAVGVKRNLGKTEGAASKVVTRKPGRPPNPLLE